jgi:hypothetical protein
MSLPLLGDIRDQAAGLTRDQRNAFLAAFLGWTMDAFDYFLLIFVITEVAKDFGTEPEKVTVATTLTLVARPLGAYLFGIWADKAGRRLPLMIDVIFSPTRSRRRCWRSTRSSCSSSSRAPGASSPRTSPRCHRTPSAASTPA